MRSLMTLCLLLCFCQPVFAAEWVLFSESNDGDKSYLDIKSITVRSTKRIAWTKVEKSVPVAYQGGLLESWKALIEVDCNKRTQRTIAEIGYQPDGNMLYEFGARETAVVVPDSLGEIRLEAMCEQPSPRPRPRSK